MPGTSGASDPSQGSVRAARSGSNEAASFRGLSKPKDIAASYTFAHQTKRPAGRPTGLCFRRGRKIQQPAAFLSWADGLKRKLLEALILIASPVRGLRPMRAARLDVTKVPKVPIWSLPPPFTPLRLVAMASKTNPTHRSP